MSSQPSGVRWTSWSSRTWRRSTCCPAAASPWPSTTRPPPPSPVHPPPTHTCIPLQWARLQGSTNLLLFLLFLPCAGSASAVEMVALLVQTGLFDSALTLCRIFKLSLTPVFEGLTYKWVSLIALAQSDDSTGVGGNGARQCFKLSHPTVMEI